MAEIEKEITVRLKWSLDETKVYFVNKGIPLIESFILKDIYLVRNDVDLDKTSNLDVLSKSIIIREVIGDSIDRKVVYKDKKYDKKGNILSSTKYSCPIANIEKMYDFLIAIGYKEIFRYEQECLSYKDQNKNILLEYIPELGLFAEIEDNNKSTEELIEDLKELNIPYCENNYFVKKASLMLDAMKNKNTKDKKRWEYDREQKYK